MAHLQAVVEAESMEELIVKCNMLSLKSGTSFKFSDSTTYDGKKYYKTYYFDVENIELFRAVSNGIRTKNNRSK